MEKLVLVKQPEELSTFSAVDKITLVTASDLLLHKPDAHWMLTDGNDNVLARCSCWWREVPEFPAAKPGFIGHYAAANGEAARMLLDHACVELAGNGCTLAVGPLDGTTWRRYRFVVERGEEPPFFLEPDNPDDWPTHFTSAGFSEFASYCSMLNVDLDHVEPRMKSVADRMDRQGISIRQFDPSRFDQELDDIFNLSLVSFEKNLLYTPISHEEFKASYQKVRPFIRPELTLLAEHEGRTVGFLFAIPDMLQAQRGETVDTVIMKSIAVLPGKSYGGLGSLLMVRTIANIRELGYKRAIHALIYDGNKSRNMSAQYASPMRRYALFSREIA